MLLIDAKTSQLSKEEVKKYPGKLSQSEKRRYFERIILLLLLFKRMRLSKNISVAYVASVSNRVIARKLEPKQKKGFFFFARKRLLRRLISV